MISNQLSSSCCVWGLLSYVSECWQKSSWSLLPECWNISCWCLASCSVGVWRYIRGFSVGLGCSLCWRGGVKVLVGSLFPWIVLIICTLRRCTSLQQGGWVGLVYLFLLGLRWRGQMGSCWCISTCSLWQLELGFAWLWFCFWNVLVGSVAFVWKPLFCIKSYSLVSYWCVGCITMGLSFFVLVTIVSCSFDFLYWLYYLCFWVCCGRCSVSAVF